MNEIEQAIAKAGNLREALSVALARNLTMENRIKVLEEEINEWRINTNNIGTKSVHDFMKYQMENCCDYDRFAKGIIKSFDILFNEIPEPQTQEEIDEYLIESGISPGQIEGIMHRTKEILESLASGDNSDVRSSIGSIRGIVKWSAVGNKCFALLEDLFERTVICYLDGKWECEKIETTGKRVEVSGLIKRNETGCPIAIRNIFDVKSLPDVEPGSYKKARGVIPWKGDR